MLLLHRRDVGTERRLFRVGAFHRDPPGGLEEDSPLALVLLGTVDARGQGDLALVVARWTVQVTMEGSLWRLTRS